MNISPKIYFAGSIRGGRDDVPIYEKIISHLTSIGEVLTEHVGDYSLSLAGQSEFSDSFIHDRDVSWLRRSDLVIAETTHPSLGVGYEIAMAAVFGIPIVALHRPATCSLSAMIAGCKSVKVIEYVDVSQALAQLDHHMESSYGTKSI